MFQSPLFKRAITHRYELTSIMRQSEADLRFVNCLKELRMGQCSDASVQFIKYLEREINVPEEDLTHIFFRKVSTQVFNIRKLQQLPGHESRFKATDVGDTSNLNCPAEKVLVLKRGCKVMLIWNKNERLRNGTTGWFLRQDGKDHIVVEFEGIGQVVLKREEWHKRNRYGEVVGSRVQFPVMLCYATTCHKTQGLTLKGAVVHCTKEFVPGLIYVAFTRVRSADNLQVINFRKQQLLPPDPQCVNVCDNHIAIQDSLRCCRDSLLLQNDHVSESTADVHEEEIKEFPRPSKDDIQSMVDSYLERGSPDDLFIDLETVHAVLADESSQDFVKFPPNTFSIRKLLENMIINGPVTEFAINKTSILEETLRLNEQIDLLGRVLWCRACNIVLEESILNTSADVKTSSKEWTLNTKELHRYLTKSWDFSADFCSFFNVKKLSEIQSTISSQLILEVYKEVVEHVSDRVRNKEMESEVLIDVREMPSEGLAKIRYIGAWATAKVLHKELKFVRANMSTKSKQTMKSVNQALECCRHIEEYIVANISQLQESSRYLNTISLTENRQYRSRGLLHIEDDVHEFFLELEALRVQNLNENRLRLAKECLIDNAIVKYE